MFEIIFLGTSASAPSIYRGLPAQAVLAGEQRFLVDCGEGTQRQILRSGIGFRRLNQILLTHPHLDHILGLGGLLSTYAHWESIDEIDIWGGTATLNRVQALLFGVVLNFDQVDVDIRLIDIKRDKLKLIETDKFSVTAFPVTHRGKGCFGYIFQEHARRPFLVEKAEALGIPVGPERSRLVKGESITLADERVITPDMVLGDSIPGAKVVFTGDTARTDNIREYVAEADILVSEATFMDVEADVARQVGHITARQAAQLAQDTGVKTLILTHISRRYRERDVREEAQATFPNTLIARDLDHYVIKKDRSVEKINPEHRR
jgi:ribonuclease Z